VILELYVIVAAITGGYVMHKALHHNLLHLIGFCVIFSFLWPAFWLLELSPKSWIE